MFTSEPFAGYTNPGVAGANLEPRYNNSKNFPFCKTLTYFKDHNLCITKCIAIAGNIADRSRKIGPRKIGPLVLQLGRDK